MELETTERMVKAAARFQACVKDVKSAKGAKGPKGAKAVIGKPEPSRREKYLSRNLAKTKAVLLAKEATAAGATSPPGESVAQISNERIIGTSDLFDINYLELAIAVGRGVARVQIGSDFGTGFLVGPKLLMTNL